MPSSLPFGSTLLPRSHLGTDGALLVIAWPGLPPVGLDTALLDRVEARESEIILAIDDLEISLFVADGPGAVTSLVGHLARYTREAEIADQDVYIDAKRRLRVRDAGTPAETDYGLLVASDPVTVCGDEVVIGAGKYRIAELEQLAEDGETLLLPSGGRLQAAMALLVVAAEKRPGGRNDYPTLECRVARYESRTHVE